MTLRIGDIIMIQGCGSTNLCKTCKTVGDCLPYVEGEHILAKIIEIHRNKTNSMTDDPMDRIRFYPVNCKTIFDDRINYTRRKWCKLAKTEPDRVMEILF